jgi:hypothetical protein
MSVAPMPAALARPLWALAVGLWVGGDSLTTAVGLASGASEVHPGAQATLATAGPAGLVAVKLLALAGFLGLFALVWRVDRHSALGVPLGLAVVGGAVTAWNLGVLGVLAA